MATNFKEKLSQAQVADAWAKITVKVWREKIVKLRIIDRSQLWQSFIHNVVSQTGGDVTKIEFAFLYYGKFVDMGVGKGVKIGDVKESATSRRLEGKMLGNRRKPKKWYSKTIAAEVKRLAEIMEYEYSHKAALTIVENVMDSSIKNQ
jgi:hypothetical protein